MRINYHLYKCSYQQYLILTSFSALLCPSHEVHNNEECYKDRKWGGREIYTELPCDQSKFPETLKQAEALKILKQT